MREESRRPCSNRWQLAYLTAPADIVDERLPYMNAGWKEVFRKTAPTPTRPAWNSGSPRLPGGARWVVPWVKAPDAMKKIRLPTTTGNFQTSTRRCLPSALPEDATRAALNYSWAGRVSAKVEAVKPASRKVALRGPYVLLGDEGDHPPLTP